MDKADHLKKMFRGACLEIDDLFLLEAFQIAYFPGWAPERELSMVLHARPEIRKFLITRCPEVKGFIDRIYQDHGGSGNAEQLEAASETLIWTLADSLVYNKCPEVYDRLPFHKWDFSEITSIIDLTSRVVIDVGAGTGRVALQASETAAVVFAVEPVSRLRQYIRDRIQQKGITNLYVVDGFLHSLPFPTASADVIITSHALGWQLENSLREFERVAKPGGAIVHCPGSSESGLEEAKHNTLIAEPWKYEYARFEEPDAPSGGLVRKYWKFN